ncbi:MULTISPECIES: hypothetical protein [unclassified Imperialibacter]|uniref:hypothetical protein n=1 Tax=unclassified Imperialibacter TaxID=2629706 RepID=UPI00125B8923|nr:MULTISPECIES: hypothetical protein [unclassified Imperialibacter]CAD5273899.1 hypothetical protein IMPERIA75_40048 [Imperialibacter sp. 75]CAD5274266.1 hypothetical protein IMPERIA89_360046 [Imperialibacter sp. 89]VVT22535.1 hypothetical protein IMPR6_360001 [Imperialibacter sp. EC-SDR9]
MIRVLTLGLFLIASLKGFGQNSRFINSWNSKDLAVYFPNLVRVLGDTVTYDNFYQYTLLDLVGVKLSLFNEPPFPSSESFILRVCYFPVFGDDGQVMTFYKDQGVIEALYKKEGDNRLKLSYFNLDELTNRESTKLKRKLEVSDEAYFYPELQPIISKSIIQDSLTFKYSQQNIEVDEYEIERLLSALDKLKLESLAPIDSTDLLINSVHEYRPIWVVEWNLDGSHNAYFRRSPPEQTEDFVRWLFSMCTPKK